MLLAHHGVRHDQLRPHVDERDLLTREGRLMRQLVAQQQHLHRIAARRRREERMRARPPRLGGGEHERGGRALGGIGVARGAKGLRQREGRGAAGHRRGVEVCSTAQQLAGAGGADDAKVVERRAPLEIPADAPASKRSWIGPDFSGYFMIKKDPGAFLRREGAE